jgi:ABC-2 type transport system permease protein
MPHRTRISAFARVVRHEARLLRMEWSTWLTVALLTTTMSYAGWNGARAAKQRLAIVDTASTAGDQALDAARRELVSAPAEIRSPAAAAQPTGRSYPVGLPPAAVAPLAVGLSDLFPYQTTVDIYATRHALFSFYQQDNPLGLLAGSFDLAFVAMMLTPLLVLALSYNSVSLEREQGTLALLLSQPVSLRAVVAAKTLVRYLVVAVPAVACVWIVLGLLGADVGHPDVWPLLAAASVALAGYLALWSALAGLVNAGRTSSAANAMILVSIWIATAVAAPAVLSVVTTEAHPLPSRMDYIARLREADNFSRGAGQELLAKFYGDHPELVPEGELDLNEFARRFYAMRQENERRMLPHALTFEAALARRQVTIDRWRWISPPLVLHELMVDLAGTGPRRHQAFVAQARDFLGQWRAVLLPVVMRKGLLATADYDRLPRFRFAEEPIAATMGRAARPAAAMWGLTVVIMGLGLWHARH